MDPFLRLIRDMDVRGWVRRYIEHAVETETPSSYVAMTALVLVASMLKRKIWIDKSLFVIRPPLQVLLVGPSGIGKSTSARYGQKLIYDLLDEQIRPWKISTSGSPEAFLSSLAEQYKRTTLKPLGEMPGKEGNSCGLQVVSELADYLPKAKYAEHFLQVLCNIYDSPGKELVRITKSGGTEEIFNVGVSAILCSNEEFLANSIPRSAVQGGFPARVIFMYEGKSFNRVCDPEDHMPSVEAEYELAQWLHNLVKKEGPVERTPEAKRWHKDWYDNRDVDVEPELQPLVKREQEHQLRIAMLLAASGSTESKVVIQQEHCEWAQGILDYAKRGIPHLYRIMATGTFGLHYEQVKRIIAKEGGQMLQTRLGKRLSHVLNITQLKEVLQTLQANGEIDIESNLRRRDHVVKLKKVPGA